MSASKDLETFAKLVVADDAPFERVEAMRAKLSSRKNAALAPDVRKRLAAAVDDGETFARDMWADLLAGMLGTKALPDLLDAARVDLGDDRDSFYARVWDLLDADPEGCRAIVLDAAKSKDAALVREAVYAMTFLPPKTGASADLLIRALDSKDATTKLLARECVADSEWAELPPIAAALRKR